MWKTFSAEEPENTKTHSLDEDKSNCSKVHAYKKKKHYLFKEVLFIFKDNLYISNCENRYPSSPQDILLRTKLWFI